MSIDQNDMTPEDNSNDKGGKGNDGNSGNKYCYMCRRSESTAGKLVHLPIGLSVCGDCMQKAFDTIKPGGAMDVSKIDLNRLNSEAGKFDFKTFNMMLGGGTENRSEEAGAADEARDVEEGLDISKVEFLLPHQIKQALDEYVVGQERAKKVISVAVYNHYKRIDAASKGKSDIEIEKSNILMLGPTGSGKTYLVQTLAKILDVPLALADATSLTEAGYIGDDIESVLSKLLSAAKGNVKKAEKGIVFIDEIDKLAKKKNAHQRDVSGESVQQGLLKLLEGSRIEVPIGASSKNAMVPVATMDTRNILFICGGAFPDIENIIKERLNKQSSMGFVADLKDKYDNEPDILRFVNSEDIRKFGMIPEFIGRLPIICHLRELNQEMLIKILREPKNAILKQYTRLLEMDEVDLIFSDDALEVIADMAVKRKTGARALRAILEEFMLDIMYEIPKDDNIGRVTITGDYIKGKAAPLIENRLVRRISSN